MGHKVLVTGASGFLGREVCKAFEKAEWDVVGTGFSRANPPKLQKLDLADHAAVASLLEHERPQVVVHSAANRFPDKCDADPEGARKLNVEATRNLAKAAAAAGSVLIYISTDYVFAGRDGEAPYEADAATAPPNLYGETKLAGEAAALEETAQAGLGVVLRVPVLYGPADQPAESAINVLAEVVQKAQAGEADASVDDWALRYPTNTEDVGRVCKDVAARYAAALAASPDQARSLPRVLQFSSEDRMTKYDVCKMLAEILGVRLDRLKPNKVGNDPNASVQRPYDTHMSTRALKELDIPVWTQDFRAWWRLQFNAVRH